LIYFISETEWNHQIWQRSFRRRYGAIESFGFGSFTDKSERFNREINITRSSNTLIVITHCACNEPEINVRLIEQLNTCKSGRRWRLFVGECSWWSPAARVYSLVNKMILVVRRAMKNLFKQMHVKREVNFTSFEKFNMRCAYKLLTYTNIVRYSSIYTFFYY